mmetsp:Transcript_99629/g.290794  ORF Transcript_99629/g.290794 Transcript_99629/m.290794 type:complete len:284 (+) Transcript_99629:47-898(+)
MSKVAEHVGDSCRERLVQLRLSCHHLFAQWSEDLVEEAIGMQVLCRSLQEVDLAETALIPKILRDQDHVLDLAHLLAADGNGECFQVSLHVDLSEGTVGLPEAVFQVGGQPLMLGCAVLDGLDAFLEDWLRRFLWVKVLGFQLVTEELVQLLRQIVHAALDADELLVRVHDLVDALVCIPVEAFDHLRPLAGVRCRRIEVHPTHGYRLGFGEEFLQDALILLLRRLPKVFLLDVEAGHALDGERGIDAVNNLDKQRQVPAFQLRTQELGLATHEHKAGREVEG